MASLILKGGASAKRRLFFVLSSTFRRYRLSEASPNLTVLFSPCVDATPKPMGTVLYDESAFRKISTSLLYHARTNPEFRDELRKALSGEEEPAGSLPSLCEAFAAVLYHGNRRAAQEGFPSEDNSEDAPIPEEVRSGVFYPDDVPPEEGRPESVVRPARLRELVEGIAYNSDLPRERTIGVEGAVARLILGR